MLMHSLRFFRPIFVLSPISLNLALRVKAAFSRSAGFPQIDRYIIADIEARRVNMGKTFEESRFTFMGESDFEKAVSAFSGGDGYNLKVF